MNDIYCDYTVAKVYEKYSRPVIRFLCCLIKDRQLSEDILHDTFVKIIEKKITISEDSTTALSYLCKISKNRAIDQLKRKKSENEKYAAIASHEYGINRHWIVDPEDMIIEGEVISTLYEVLQGFPDDERTIFLESVLSEKTTSRLADEFNRSEYHVKRIVNKINHDIKNSLGELNGDDALMHKR